MSDYVGFLKFISAVNNISEMSNFKWKFLSAETIVGKASRRNLIMQNGYTFYHKPKIRSIQIILFPVFCIKYENNV